MLDGLHGAGIEIVSPNFMNTRAVPEGKTFMAEPARSRPTADRPLAEEVAFDKAEDAASLEKIRAAIDHIDHQLKGSDDSEAALDPDQKAELETRKTHLVEQLKLATDTMKGKQDSEKQGAPCNPRIRGQRSNLRSPS